MDTASEILVIIVSSVLVIFLIVLIILVVYAVSVIKQVRRILERADNVAGSVEAAAAAFERTASPLAFIKLVGNIVEQATRIKRRKDK